LYELPALRELTEEIMPKDGASFVLFHGKTKRQIRSKVEAVAIKRAILTQTLDAAEKAIRRLPREHKKVYRLKYRSGLTVRQMAARLYFCTTTVQQKVDYIRDHVALYLRKIPGSEIQALTRAYDQKRTEQ
jgi:DNA-directed RNA polymerase specialized sigma24 family protein